MRNSLLGLCFISPVSEIKYYNATNSEKFPAFGKKTANLQVSPSQNIFPNKRTVYLCTVTCNYDKAEILSLYWE
jgi:hypothetical protein